MTRIIIASVFFFCCHFLQAQEVNQVMTDANGRKKMLGEITKKGLTSHTFETWFTPNYEAYQPNEKNLKKLGRKLKMHTITVFMGTWCGDSKREVPRLYRVLEAIDFPESQLRVVGLDNASSTYKQGPNGEEKGMRIHRVPTIIVYDKKGKELGRIVEHPVETLEADLLKIIRKKPYKHHYQAVTKLQELFTKKGISNIRAEKEKTMKLLKSLAKNERDLNTYGHVLLSAKEFEKSLLVFQLNAALFPDKKRVYNSLGAYFYTTVNNQKAIENYRKTLAIDANDATAKTMLSRLQN